ncbi:MAG TPA: hypothetical protein DDZ80_17290 [Cyanobacteria bacterium UBA8803]|nr:hypothetical protein [Cyanobacteria bacterium UBA9273]HBL60151.1 hypothetical protein [Cyanobacteria bacterium UBA8803]
MEFNQEFAANLLIATVYIIVVNLVFNRALRSLDVLFTIEHDADYLNQQLIENDINEIMAIKFAFKEKYRIDELRTITLNIENKSKDSFIEVDWKEAFISDFENRMQPLGRVVSGTTNISQDPSKILPGRKLDLELSDENVASPLLDPKKVQAAAQNADSFFIRFLVKRSQPGSGANPYYLRCRFIVKKLIWQKALALSLQPK